VIGDRRLRRNVSSERGGLSVCAKQLIIKLQFRGLIFFLNDVVQSCRVAIDEKPLNLIAWAAKPILNCFQHFAGPVGLYKIK
jgi:hypothetical protein